MRAYEYLFYMLYRWSSRWRNDVAPAQVNAFLLVVAIVWCNLFLLVEIAELSLRVSVLPVLSKTAILCSVALSAIPQYFALLHKQRYKAIVKKFEVEAPRQRRVRSAVASAYIISLFLSGLGGAIIHARVFQH
jgi:hypothetical protein